VTPDVSAKKDNDIQQIENIEYVSEQLDLKGTAPEVFSSVFAQFRFESEDSKVRMVYKCSTFLPVLLFSLR
jgi:hypothetical protein